MNNADATQTLLDWMGSLSEATRLRVLRLLERRELGVAELCEVLQMPQSTVSRHLKLLTDLGWTRNRREGTANLYRMILDELDPAARRLWVLAREQTADWPTVAQDELRLERVLAARSKDSQAFFEGAAGQWDGLRDELYGRSFSVNSLLALLPREWTVADLGCGTGALIADLAPHVARVIGVDQSPAMLKAAKKRTEKRDNVDLQRSDLAKTPIKDASCDAALIVLVLTYIRDPQAVLAEAARIIRPGGKLVVVDLLHHGRDDFRRHMGQVWPGFEPRQINQWMESAGLKTATHGPIPPEPQAKGPALQLVVGVRK